MKWFRKWKKYTGFDSWDQHTAGQASVHPGPIDDAILFKGSILDLCISILLSFLC